MLADEALRRIGDDPKAHLQAVPLMAYRGIMSERGLGFSDNAPANDEDDSIAGTTLGEYLGTPPPSWLYGSPLALSLILFVPAILAFPFCLVTRRWPLVFLMAPAAFLFAFQAMFSQFLIRYATALYPMLMVIALISLSALLDTVLGYRTAASRQAS